MLPLMSFFWLKVLNFIVFILFLLVFGTAVYVAWTGPHNSNHPRGPFW